MLKELRFVQGSVAKKDFVPALSHFVIESGQVRGFNGTLALCSPIQFDLACKPKAETLIRAIDKCEDTVQLTLTPAGRLAIRSGKFKAFVDCIEGDTPHAMPEGEDVQVDGNALLLGIKKVAPFIGDDASRPWSNGVLLKGSSAFATNNVMLIEYWTGGQALPFPINLPRSAVREMLRIDEAPVRAQVSETSITFHYEGDRWLRSQLLETDWPDLSRILDGDSTPVAIDEQLFTALSSLKPFCDKMGRIMFDGKGRLSTHFDETEGASYDIPGFEYPGLYRIEMLELLQGTATHIDWALYPAPCKFYGDRLRGAIIGMKQ